MKTKRSRTKKNVYSW